LRVGALGIEKEYIVSNKVRCPVILSARLPLLIGVIAMNYWCDELSILSRYTLSIATGITWSALQVGICGGESSPANWSDIARIVVARSLNSVFLFSPAMLIQAILFFWLCVLAPLGALGLVGHIVVTPWGVIGGFLGVLACAGLLFPSLLTEWTVFG
jgi:hypothetical protein